MSNTDDDRTADFKQKIKQFTQPLVDSLDARLRDEIDARVDVRVDEAVRDRLTILERAVADLDRAVRELAARVDGQA